MRYTAPSILTASTAIAAIQSGQGSTNPAKTGATPDMNLAGHFTANPGYEADE